MATQSDPRNFFQEDKLSEFGHENVGPRSPRVSEQKETAIDRIWSRQSRRSKNARERSPADGSSDETKTVVSFAPNDPENPYNWSSKKKIYILLVGIVSTLNSTLDSSLAAGATTYLSHYFHVTSQAKLVLPTSLYLIGYTFGPLVFAPLSETYGRRIITLSTFALFTVFTLACALAPTWESFLVFRFIVGVNASSAIAVTGGLFADVYADPVMRGRAMAYFMASTSVGPQLAPSISGFVSVISWRWAFWIGLMVAGISMIFLAFLPETFGPVILQKRAKRIRKSSGNPNIFSPHDFERKGLRHIFTVVLTRPLRMFFFEPIVLLSCLYLSFVYAIFYLFFEAYPLIFEGVYGLSTGLSGVAFLPIIAGAFAACAIFLWYDRILQRAKKRNAAWSQLEEYRRLPLACLAGPLCAIPLFWLGWSARPDVPWIVPALAGVPFGIGYLLIFMALLNYLADAYGIFAASAMAASSCSRSAFGATLPLAANPMYEKLGIAWASSLLGFVGLIGCIIPFAFIKYGARIREQSAFCKELAAKRDEVETDEKREEAEG